MNIVIIGAGGIGAFYGMILNAVDCNITFIARGETLDYLKENKMKVTYENTVFEEHIKSYNIDDFCKSVKPEEVDLLIIATKAMSTEAISKALSLWIKDAKKVPYYLSIQNGVENEDVMSAYYPKDYVLGGLTRLIVSHTIALGHVHCLGEVQTLMGALNHTKENNNFLNKLKTILDKTQTSTFICEDIKLELWNKLIINNGVNAICALLEERTRPLLTDEKTAKIIYGLMSETALAAKAVGVKISKEGVDKMFDLIKGFENLKPSMYVDLENNRDLELDEICGVVVRNCEKLGIDAPYTRTISTILEYTYNRKRAKLL
jgi:2-dehydropantoate 2-reductase